MQESACSPRCVWPRLVDNAAFILIIFPMDIAHVDWPHFCYVNNCWGENFEEGLDRCVSLSGLSCSGPKSWHSIVPSPSVMGPTSAGKSTVRSLPWHVFQYLEYSHSSSTVLHLKIADLWAIAGSLRLQKLDLLELNALGTAILWCSLISLASMTGIRPSRTCKSWPWLLIGVSSLNELITSNDLR